MIVKIHLTPPTGTETVIITVPTRFLMIHLTPLTGTETWCRK